MTLEEIQQAAREGHLLRGWYGEYGIAWEWGFAGPEGHEELLVEIRSELGHWTVAAAELSRA